MIERIEEMPAGTMGLRASGKLTREDYRDVLEPALREGGRCGRSRFSLPARFGSSTSAIRRAARVGRRLSPTAS